MATPCEQAAIDLAAYKQALADLLTGTRVSSVSHGDKRTDFSAGDTDALQDLIRMKQAEVDACNGVRRGRAFRFIPAGW